MLPTKPRSLVSHLDVSQIPPGAVTQPPSGAPDHSSGEFFPNIPPLVQLESIPFCPIAVTWKRRPTPTLPHTPLGYL